MGDGRGETPKSLPPSQHSAIVSPMPRLFLVLGGAVALLSTPVALQRARFEVPVVPVGARWLKGNTHTHTTVSDGDTPPADVARWYKSREYAFLVLSDHNVFTDPKTLSSLTDSTFLLLASV